jgi:phenol hydroxylase P4 protein
MPVVALKKYEFEPADALEKFHGAQVLFIGWEDHLMFCAPFAFPLPGSMPFGALIAQVIPGAFGAHPDLAKVDWAKVEWFRSGKPFKPDPARSLIENGLGHKAVLRFRTPGLTGIKGSCA